MLRRIRPGGSSSQLDIGPIARKDHGLIAREYREGEHVGMAQVEDRLLVHGRRSTRVLIADDSAQVRRGLTGLFALGACSAEQRRGESMSTCC